MLTTAILFAGYSVHIDARLIFWAAVGAVFGVVMFCRGFQMLRYKRLILNTPESKVRSASMGPVEIEGMAKGPHTIPAGITGEQCFYYRAMAWQLRESGRNQQWQKVADESLYLPFFIEDSTGRMLVNPAGAELDVHCNFKDEVGTSFFSHSEMMPANISAFLGRNGLALTDKTRIEEYCIKPAYPLFIFGTLGRNDARVEWTPVAQIADRKTFKTKLNPFGPLGSFGMQIIGASAGISPALSTIQPSQVAVSRTGAAPARQSSLQTPAAPAASSWSSVSMDEAGMPKFGAAIARHAASAPAPASGKSATAVADRAPAPATPPVAAAPPPPAVDADGFEINPSVAIGKGSDGAPFTISSNSQKDVVRMLAWKSTLCIWGGPILTLVSLYVLGLSFGVL